MKNVVDRTLNVAHFVKLLPIIERSKDQVNSGTISNVVINIETGKTSISESIVNYDKVYINAIILVNILIFYAIIRDLHDIDNLDFSSAIFLYIRQILI